VIQYAKPVGGLTGGFGHRSGFGVEVTFGHKLGDALKEPVVLIKAAASAKSLVEDFRPLSAVAKRGGEIGPYFTGMMRKYAHALQHLDTLIPELAGRGYEISGFIWFQGEADANRFGKAAWDEYEDNLKDLIYDVRTSFGVPEMPALIIQINVGPWGGDEPDLPDGTYSKGGFFIRETQKRVAEQDPHADWVLTRDQKQAVHYDSASYLVIGERCGEKMLGLLNREPQNHRDNPAIRATIQKYVLDKILPPSTEQPDMNALRKGLYAYFPFEEGEGATVTGAAVQPVSGKIAFAKLPRRARRRRPAVKGQDLWVEGIKGKAIRFRGRNLLHFPDFKEPVDDRGLLGDMTVSFWIQMNSGQTRAVRLGRGAGLRYPGGRVNWMRSYGANYAGWDISTVGGWSEISFTATFERIGVQALIAPSAPKDGITWSHVVAIYNRGTGKKNIWLNGNRFPRPFVPTRKRKTPPPDPLEGKGYGIVSADVPLAIGVQFDNPSIYTSFDELCIWNRALSEDEVKALYNNGHGLKLEE
jgi:hypothetical protein